jgi:hypothetical protein
MSKRRFFPGWPAIGSSFRHRRLFLGALLGVLALGAGALALDTHRSSRNRIADDPRQRARITIMQDHLAMQSGPFVILAGDSQAEFLNWDRVCGLPVVNLGLSGIAAAHYGKVLSLLQPARRAEAALLLLGTNDLARKTKPESDRSLARFQQRFGGVIADLGRFASRTVYAPVIPGAGDARSSVWLATERQPDYARAATEICLAGGCQPLDFEMSFAEDGVHLDRDARMVGRGLHRALEEGLCPDKSSAAGPSGTARSLRTEAGR